MRVAYDFDDTCVDFVQSFLEAVLDRTGQKFTRASIELSGWDMGPWANRVLGMPHASPLAWLDWFVEDLGYWRDAPTIEGVVGAMEALHSLGHGVEIVTSKSRAAYPVVWEWLRREDPPVITVHMLNGFSKHDVSGADVLVDDRPDTVRAWEASRPGRRLGVLFARSQNEGSRQGLVVAESHDEALAIIRRWERWVRWIIPRRTS